jgi:hypothetical protein
MISGLYRLLLTSVLILAAVLPLDGAQASVSSVEIDGDDIGGIVSGPHGPEAGVWVIAETSDLPARFIKIVVTDDNGRYVLPDLPKAKYKVWVRGYGLVDSKPLDAVPGKIVDLKAVPAPNAAEAAEIYPANYWFSLIQVPDASEFPGTGPEGNGISTKIRSQTEWLGQLKEGCEFCHQMGTKVTRTLPVIGDPVLAWDQRVQRRRAPDDENRNDSVMSDMFGSNMSNNMSAFGRQRGLQMFADWTTRIADGELPPVPPRPVGQERNVVLTLWDFGELSMHDSSVSDRRNPTVNANGLVFGLQTHSGQLAELDPNTGLVETYKLAGISGQWNKDLFGHTSIMDGKGRVWISNAGKPEGPLHTMCTDPDNPYAKLFPLVKRGGRFVTIWDPKTKKNTQVPVCFGNHHLHLTKDDRMYFSGDAEVTGWIDLKTWDKTHDPVKSAGWCPHVLDTNGDGKITMDRAQWNPPAGQAAEGEGAGLSADGKAVNFDPSKDTRHVGFPYGMGISPKDQSYWAADYRPTVPTGLLRVDPGKRPPETCQVEYYESPLIDGKFKAFNARGVDIDADGIAWVAFGSGHLGRFDRSQCKVMKGPTATGQQCKEGWQLIDMPGPKLKGTDVGSDWTYQVWVDHKNVMGLGAETVMLPVSESDELLAYIPKDKKFVHLRVPYPLGFYTRGIDSRVDNTKTGWKGRALWASNNLTPKWHQEGGEEENEKMVKFQLRPNPLAH